MRPVFVLIILASASQAATITQAYSFSTFGVSGSAPGVGCTTYGPTSVVQASGINGGIQKAGAGCGPAEDLKNVFGAGNLVTASTSTSGAASGANGAYSGSGSANSKAASNLLGVDAQFTLFGNPDSFSVAGSESIAYFSESLGTSSGVITGGSLRYTLALTGSQSIATTVPGFQIRGEGFFGLWYRRSGAAFLDEIFYGSTGGSGGTLARLLGTYYDVTRDGITVGNYSLAVNRIIQFTVPFDSSVPYQASFTMYAGASASTNSDILIQYGNTLQILNVEAFDDRGNSVGLVRSSAESNESAVPEPNTAVLCALLALASLATIRGRAVPGHNPARPNPLRRLFRLG